MLFGPKNSVIVPFDYSGPDSFQDFEDKLKAIKEHYRFSKLSEIASAVKKKKRQGLASIVLENPRKGVFLLAIPTLLSLEIPFTLFVDPDYLGLNRLPIEEELKAYQQSYPEKFSEQEFQKWCELARKNPTEADLFLKNCRQTLGPLRVDELDSLQFFTTWGKVLELPPDLAEVGVSVNHQIASREHLEEKITFVEKQLKKRPMLVRGPKQGFSSKEMEFLRKSQIEAVLGHTDREVTKQTSVFDLPVWRLTSSL